ncbi:MAG: YIP1 family protein [Candidatus Eisenbacteria bacterium]|nr:YIP1 family protein [Candidatus Eisenbacteria bacterium]
MSQFTDRLIRAARLDATLFEEVEADEESLGQAIAAVLLFGLAGGVGTLSLAGLRGLFAGAVLALAGWFLWANLVYWIGTRLLPERQTDADLGQLLRTIGFSSAPGILLALGVIPPIRFVVYAVGLLWMLAAMVVAVRQALDYTSTRRALEVCLIGWLVLPLLLSVPFIMLGR